MSVFTYVVPALILGTAYDQSNNARHDARVQEELQRQQLEDAARVNQQNLDAQYAAQEAQTAMAQQQLDESKAQMERQLKQADENMNRANQKRPNTSRILDQATQAGRAGASGTMLTGSLGVDPSSLQLGRNTLLGM